MRLTEDQVQLALKHANKDVLQTALFYFANCYTRNPAITQNVIEVLEQYKIHDAFTYIHPIRDLQQSEETIA